MEIFLRKNIKDKNNNSFFDILVINLSFHIFKTIKIIKIFG